MGTTTDYLGHIDVTPALNEAEQTYLQLFSDSRRFVRPGGPYEVPGNPAAERDPERPVSYDDFNTPGPGQPQLHCDWVPCLDGCCLTWNGYEKPYALERWLSYIVEHFLAPGAHASTSDLDWFREFTFDHRLDGVMAGCRRSDKELFLVRVEHNVVTREVLSRPDARYQDYPFPYETQIDRWLTPSQQRRRRRGAG